MACHAGGSLIYNNGLPSTRFTAHEMGHNYGLSHSASIELGPGGEVPADMVREGLLLHAGPAVWRAAD